MKFITKYKIYIFEILFLILLSLTPLLWFKQNHIVIGIDSGFPVDYVKYFQQREFTWLGSQNFGIDMSAEVGVMPYSGLSAVINMIGFSHYDVQKVLFVFWFLLITFSIYVFLAYLFPKKEYWVVRLTGVIIYSFSLHLYSFWLQGEQPILASYVILPFFSLFLLRFAKDNSSVLKTSIYLNLVYFLFSSGGVRGLPLIGPVIVTSFVITAYYFLINFSKEGLGYIKRFLILALYSFAFLILCNAYFLFPFISSFLIQYSSQVAIAGGVNGAIEWAKFISTHTSFTNLFRLHGDNSWYSRPYLWSNAYLTNPILIFASFVYPILAFVPPILAEKKERKLIILLLFIALFGLFFSAGAHLPLGYIYIFMMEHIPGFAAFRSGYYKFMPIVYLAFSALIGLGIYYICNKLPKNIGRLVGILAILIILLYHYPYFTNNNFDFNKPFSTMVKVPNYVYDFAKMQSSVPDRFRTLVVPPPSEAFNIKTYTWGYWGSYPLFPLITDRNFVVNDAFVYNESENRFINLIYESLRKNDIKTFLNGVNNANIKYVLLTKDIAKDYVMSFSQDPLVYSNILGNKDNFRMVWQNGPWQLYEIVLANPKKIEAFNSVVNKTEENTPIDNLLYTNSFPFVNNLDQGIAKKLPIKADLIDFLCVTCVLLDGDPGPAIDTQNVIPSSIFYQFKLAAEKDLQKVTNSEQKIDALLGLSRKRVSEIDRLNYMPPYSESKWLVGSSLLNAYWKQLRLLYEKDYKGSINYSLLRRISQYLIFERNTITNVIKIRGYDNKNVLGRSLLETVNEMNAINKHLGPKINAKNWKSTFIYDISKATNKVFINKSNLPRDLSNNPVYPFSYEINQTAYPYNQNQEYISLPKDKKTLTLEFNLSNLYLNPEKIVLDYNNETRNCLVSSITNYSGLKKYMISLNVDDIDAGIMHIKRDYKIFKTLDYVESSSTQENFKPDLSVATYTSRTGKFEYKFSGKANDKSAIIYFCSNRLQDPSQVFRNITVTEEVSPSIYDYIDKQINLKSKPKVSFNKLSPSKYKVVIKNAKSSFILSFSERFSPLWEATINNENISDHFMINGYGNGWYIDKKGDYNIMLYFNSEKKFEIGLTITFITILSLLFYLVYAFTKKHK